MRSKSAKRIREAVLGLSFFVAASGLAAQGRLNLPEGSVIIVRTTTPIQSASARVGQTFETIVVDTVRIDGYTGIPAGSRIRGVMTFVQPASGNRAGVIEVDFDRLTLDDGTVMPINAKLTSTDPEERRQIEQDPNARVVLVGGRGRVGAGVVGAGSESNPASTILVAIDRLLGGRAANVNVAAGTALAVQLEQPLILRGRGRYRSPDAYTIFTTTELIQDAQRALARLNYYRGSINGSLDYATQRALFEYQIDKGISATGNLDWRTARSLGLNFTTVGGNVGGNAGGDAVLSFEEASAVRRNAQSLLASARNALGITSLGRLSGRIYHEEDFEVWFALSSFADNASLYEQVVRNSGSADGSALAGRALLSAARRVDTAIQRNRVSGQVQNAWSQIRSQLSGLDVTYR